MFDAARRSIPDQPATPERIRFALRYVAHLRGTNTVRPEQYERTREARLETARQRSRREERALRERMPTLQQILSLYPNDWDAALIVADLEARQPLPPPAGQRRRRNEQDVADAVRRYATWLKDRPSTDHRWRKFAALHPGTPSLGTLKRRGGIPKLLAETARADQAELLAARKEQQRAHDADARARSAKTRRSQPGPRAQQVLSLLKKAGPLGTVEIAAEFGIHREAARQAVNHLIRLGHVQRTEQRANARGQRYEAK